MPAGAAVGLPARGKPKMPSKETPRWAVRASSQAYAMSVAMGFPRGQASILDSRTRGEQAARMPAGDPRSRLLQILLERSLRFGSFRLASGTVSDYYVDVRKTSLDPEGLALVATLLADAAGLGEPDGPDTVGGPAIGADPIVAALGLEAWRRGRRLDLFLVRKEEKDHGVAGRIVGHFREGARVLLVDDVLTQGGSLADVLAVVEAAGATVSDVGCVVDRRAGGAERLRAPGRALHALFAVEELLAAGRSTAL